MTAAFAALTALQNRYASTGCGLPPALPDPEYWRGGVVGIAGVPLLVAARDIEAVIAVPVLTPIPGTRNWVLGIASHHGGLLPVCCGDSLFGQPLPPGRRREYCLVIKRPGLYVGITLSRVEGNIKLPMAQRATETRIEGPLAACCDGGFWQGERFLGLLDSSRLATVGALSDTAARPEAIAEDSAS
ncbi:chemotaxis protein CheW [Haliea sp. E1-2-M8]|uniref:chemotaxis protein CheW n=1 Tax=Haliea sp. E1-2-M8 TaxID=3064706 RepID=UPI0027194EC6|nr:chemotaxis protein CheW [Haliea sp. E1-2-M8]MDO8860087.1 chemotaxis protein CheW [Haliea sp. E1-2-M8]